MFKKMMMAGLIAVGLLLCVIPVAWAVTLDIGTESSVHAEAWMSQIAQFEKENPEIRIEPIIYPAGKWYDQLITETAINTGLYDLAYYNASGMEGFLSADYLYPLTESEFDLGQLKLEDLAYIEGCMSNGILYLVPFRQAIEGTLYRKDLFEDPEERVAFANKYGYELRAPETFEEMRDVAEFFTRPEQNFYGLVLFGGAGGWLSINGNRPLWSYDAWWINRKTLKPDFNNPRGVKALRWFKRKFLYADPACVTYNWFEALSVFLQGRAAMFEGYTPVLLYAEDPTQSKVVGKVGFGPVPRPENIQGPFPGTLNPWGFYLVKSCEEKQAAFKWLDYISSKETLVRTVVDTKLGNTPARYSALTDPRTLQRFPWMKEFAEQMRKLSEGGLIIGGQARIPEASTVYRQVVNKYLVKLELGELTVEEMVKNCEEEINSVLKH